jgi:hypothetical protein
VLVSVAEMLQETWLALRTWLSSWPPLVWAALGGSFLGSFLTLLGVFLQNVYENKRHRQNLEHDARQRANERDQHLKRDVFMQVVDAADESSRALGHFAGMPLGEAEKNALRGVRVGPFWKGHLVGRMRTIEALLRIGEAFDRGLIDLLEARADVDAATVEHDSAAKHTDQLLQSSEGYRVLVEELSKSGQSGTTTMRELLAKWESTNERTPEAIKAQEKARRQMEGAHLRLVSVLTEAAMRYQRALAAATPALRGEIHLEEGFEADTYTRLVTESLDETKRRFEEAWERMRVKYNLGPAEDQQ